MKRWLTLVFTLVLALTAVFASVAFVHAEEAAVLDSGSCGTSVNYTLYSNGLLEITGTGPMDDYARASDTSWYDNRDLIKTVVIDSGVTSIGQRAFTECSNLKNITIPEGVTSIGKCAFYECSSLERVEIPNGVTSIEDSVFAFCENLNSVVIPNGVTSIGNSAFLVCSSLETVRIPSGVVSIGEFAFSDSGLTEVIIPGSVASIERAAFQSCFNLTKAEICDGVTNLGTYMFSNCEKLATVTGMNSVTSIGDGAFEFCRGLTAFTIPTGVTHISSGMFYNCNNLTDITIPYGVTSIGSSAFFGCGVTFTELPGSVTSIGDAAFGHCAMESFTIPAGVTRIEEATFYYCSNLKNITIHDDVTYIGNWAFSCCDNLENVIIPDSVTAMGECPFDTLRDLYYEGTQEQWEAITNALDIAYVHYSCTDPTDHWLPGYSADATCETDGFIGDYCSCGYVRSTEITQSALGHDWDDGIITVEPTQDTDGQQVRTCRRCGATKTEVISIDGEVILLRGQCGENVFFKLTGEGLLEIKGTGAMDDYVDDDDMVIPPWIDLAESVKTAVVEPGVTHIGAGAFWCCSNMESVTIDPSVTSIGPSAFGHCYNLIEVNIPEGVTVISEGLFYECTSLPKITIPSGVVKIEYGAFYCCESLESIVIPKNVTSIGECAFWGCKSAETIAPLDNVTSLGGGAFAFCRSLKSIAIPENITSIGEYTFDFCSSLESITIPESVTSIGEHAFSYCSSLESITIPESVTSVGENAFYECSSLEDIYFGGTSEQWSGLSNRPEAPFIHYACTEPAGHWTTHSEGAACEAEGYSCERCSCGYEKNQETQAALGHDWDEGVVTVQPTTDSEGERLYTCRRCGATRTEPISALPGDISINDQVFGSITEALAAAESGDTVELMADVDASGETLIVRPGVTLNLGTHDLIADGFIGFNGSYLNATRYSATGDYGKLIVPKENLVLTGGEAATNEEYDVIPVWNGEDAYVLANAMINDTDAGYGLKIDEEAKTISFSFAHKAGGSANKAFFLDGTGDNAMKIIIRLEWASGNGVAYQDFVYNDDFVGKVSQGGYNYSFVLNNYDILNIDISNLKVTAMILTDSGTITAGQIWTQENAN